MANANRIFANYLDSKGIRYQIRNEESIAITYNGDNAPEIRLIFVFGDDGSDVAIRAFSVAKVPSEKLARAYKTCSVLNNKWRWMKFYVDSDDEVTAADDAVIEPNTLAEECFELLLREIDIVDKAYPDIMAAIWGSDTTDSSVSAPQKR